MRNKLFYSVASKTFLLPVIYRNHPPNYLNMTNVDLMGGSGIWLYKKPRSENEIYNDLNQGLSAIFWCLINDFEKFCFRLQFTQHSELIFNWFKEFQPKTKLDLAVKTIVEAHYSYGGGLTSTFARRPQPMGKRKLSFVLFDYNLFLKWNKRFTGVQIYSEDYKSIIERTDNDKTFYYCDPPYLGTEDVFPTGTFDHKGLANTLSDIRGKFLLSYNDDPFISRLYEGFDIKRVKTRYPLSRKENAVVTELLISNYSLPKSKKLTTWVKELPIKVMS